MGRRIHVVSVAIVIAVVATAASCSADRTNQSSGTVGGREAAAVATKIASVGYQAFTTVNRCIKNREIGQPCTASDATNIRQTLKEVRELRSDIERNQQQVLAEFDAIKDLILDKSIKDLAAQLRDMEVNSVLAMKAFEALSECVSTTNATCQPFIGVDGAPLTDIATAIEKTKAALIDFSSRLPSDIAVTASWFTGAPSIPDGGLADAIWMYNKAQQESKAGVTDAAVKRSATVPILTPELATAQNDDLTFWVDTYSEYAFLSVQYAGLTGGAQVAERRQALVDSKILDRSTRNSVLGEAIFYSVPPVPAGVVAIAVGDKVLMISNRTLSNSRPLLSDDVAALGIAINKYSSVDDFLKMSPATLPDGGWYDTKTSIERVGYRLVGYAWGEIGAETVDVNWLSEPGSTSTSCSTRVRLANAPQTRPSGASGADGDGFDSKPAMVPTDRLLRTWERFAKDKPIALNWDSKDLGSAIVGWGAWVKCDASFTGSVVQLSTFPGVMAQAK